MNDLARMSPPEARHRHSPADRPTTPNRRAPSLLDDTIGVACPALSTRANDPGAISRSAPRVDRV